MELVGNADPKAIVVYHTLLSAPRHVLKAPAANRMPAQVARYQHTSRDRLQPYRRDAEAIREVTTSSLPPLARELFEKRSAETREPDTAKEIDSEE